MEHYKNLGYELIEYLNGEKGFTKETEHLIETIVSE
jgi:hypothetical protein